MPRRPSRPAGTEISEERKRIFSERLRARLTELGWTQEDLAYSIRTTARTINYWVNGHSYPSDILAVAIALDTTVDRLDPAYSEHVSSASKVIPITESALSADELALLSAYRNGDLNPIIQILAQKTQRTGSG